jgi:hypothetical protein
MLGFFSGYVDLARYGDSRFLYGAGGLKTVRSKIVKPNTSTFSAPGRTCFSLSRGAQLAPQFGEFTLFRKAGLAARQAS